MNRALRTALKMWDTVPEAMGELVPEAMEKLVPCPMCHGNGYMHDEDGPADCRHCNSQGEVAPDRATYRAVSNGD
jgi:DnaJ-class molecular chaperone